MVVRVEKKNYNAGIWMPIHLVDMAELPPSHRRDMTRRFLELGQALGLRKIGEGTGPIKKNCYPKIKFFLAHGR